MPKPSGTTPNWGSGTEESIPIDSFDIKEYRNEEKKH